jgi:hypothetical protein
VKLSKIVFVGFLLVLPCLADSGSQAEPIRVLGQIYREFFYDPDYYDKWKFKEAVKKAREIDSQSPFPEMIQCLMDYVDGNYPRALFQLSEAERKLGDSRKYDLDANGYPFSMGAHIAYRKFKILSNIGRVEEAVKARKDFIDKKRFHQLGFERKWSMPQYFSEISIQVRDLCIMARFEDAQSLVDGLEREILGIEEDREEELGKIYLALSKSHLLYFKTKKPEEKLKFLEAEFKELPHEFIMSEMAWAGSLLGREEEFSIVFFSELAAQKPKKESAWLYPWDLGKIAFANADWKQVLKQFETAWKHVNQKNRPYRQIAARNLRMTVAQVLVEWGYPYRALGVVDRILKSPPRWSGSGDGLESWMNELYLTGILAIDDCRLMEGAIDERITNANLNENNLEEKKNEKKIALDEWLKETPAGRYGRKFLWEQAVRSNVAKASARKNASFVRDAFHLSGARPWLWHVFIKVMGPRRTEMLMKEFPFVGVRGDLYNDFARAEIAYLREDWSGVRKHALAARQNLPEAKIFLKIRMGGLLLKACKELNLDPPEDGVEEVIRTLHPILLRRLGLNHESKGSSGKKELLSAFRLSAISSKDIDFLIGKNKRTQQANP